MQYRFRNLIFLAITIAWTVFSISPVYSASFDLTLQWDENSEPDLAVGENPRYKIYYKTGASGFGIKSNFDGLPSSEPAVGDEGPSPIGVTVARDENPDPGVVQFTFHNLDDACTYYMAVSALDNSGNESELSEEISTVGISGEPDGDSDGDGLTDRVDTDDDNDGMPDVWENEVGLNPVVHDASSDSDTDGVINLDEYKNDTDPLYKDYAKKAVLALPQNGAANIALAPMIQLTNYSQISSDTATTLDRTQWQICSSRDFQASRILLDVTSDSALEEMQVPEFILKPDTQYYWRAKFYDHTNIGTQWSDVSTFRTTSTSPLDVNGVYSGQAVATGTVDLDGVAGPDTFSSRYRALNTVVGQGMIGLKVGSGVAIEALQSIDPEAISDSINRPENIDMGLVQFRLTGPVGFQPEITLYFSQDLPDNAAWYKYDPVNGWMDCDDITEIAGTRKIILTLEDGGAGDADGVSNGVIIDPSGFGDGDSGAPAVASGAGGGGGCFIGQAMGDGQEARGWGEVKTKTEKNKEQNLVSRRAAEVGEGKDKREY